eukprot:TRINITY_DN857_c0_g1_i2.p1 TRINITY_DN857_c0_g1~~TRINITY_DN857_c0_g1_i2.p1  ORF type:complete len:689 (+),score=81.12 TRINITY_DN857_c0_g1_i2:9525-11591(+)
MYILQQIVLTYRRRANILQMERNLSQSKIALDRVQGISEGSLSSVQCQICKALALEPISCGQGKIYCKRCIEEWVQEHEGKCPCGEVYQKSFPSSSNILLNLIRIKCVHSTNGCTSALKLEELQSHEQNCEYRPVKCECGEVLPAIRMEEHQEEKKCGTSLCKFCRKVIRKVDIETHKRICTEKLLPCNYCGELRKQGHELVCDKRKIFCKLCGGEIEIKRKVKHYCVGVLAKRVKEIEDKEVIWEKVIRKYEEQINMLLQEKISYQREITKLKHKLEKYEEDKEWKRKKVEEEDKESILMKECEICKAKNIQCPVCDYCGKTTCESCVLRNQEENTKICKNCLDKLENPPSEPVVMTKTCPNCYEEYKGYLTQDHCSILYTLNYESLALYDIKTKEVTVVPNKLTKRYYAISSVKVSNVIYVSGGCKRLGPALNITECIKLNPDSSITEHKLANMKIARYCHTLIGMNTKEILCIGGLIIKSKQDDYDYLKSCEVYNIKKNRWVETAVLNKPKMQTSACNFGQKQIYAFGSLKVQKNTIERLDYSGFKKNWKWEMLKYNKREKILERKIYCNFMKIGENEILFLNFKGVSWNYQVDKNKFAKMREAKGKCLKKFRETVPIKVNEEVYFWDYPGQKVWIYSVKSEIWRIESITDSSMCIYDPNQFNLTTIGYYLLCEYVINVYQDDIM